MNRGLLIWNIIVTLLFFMIVIGGCTSDTRINWLVEQVNVHSAAIQQLQTNTEYDRQLIQSQLEQLVQLQTYTETRLNQLEQMLQVYAK